MANFIYLTVFFINNFVLPRNPYPQNVTKESFYLLWETPVRMQCSVKIIGADGETRTGNEKKPILNHQIRFMNLTPLTKYNYEVVCNNQKWKGHVRTAPMVKSPFVFIVYGDNRWDRKQHNAVVQAILRERPDFLLNTGDLVHDGTRKKYWYSFFKIESPLLRNIPLFPTPGNHENPISKKGAKYWRRFFEVPHNGPIDEMSYYFDWGNSRFFILDYNRFFVASSQERWFRAVLEETAMDPSIQHIFVAIHKSPYTSGPHGPNKHFLASGVIEDMKKYGVDIIFGGHDHIYERGRVNGLNYVISGGGGAPIYYVRGDFPYSIVTEPVLHYVKISVNGARVSLNAYRVDGSQIDFMMLDKSLKGGIKIEIIKESPKKRALIDATGIPEKDEDLMMSIQEIRHSKEGNKHFYVIIVFSLLLISIGIVIYKKYL